MLNPPWQLPNSQKAESTTYSSLCITMSWLTSIFFGAYILLVGGWATPLKNMSSSIGMMKATPINMGKQSKWQPNHQPDFYIFFSCGTLSSSVSTWTKWVSQSSTSRSPQTPRWRVPWHCLGRQAPHGAPADPWLVAKKTHETRGGWGWKQNKNIYFRPYHGAVQRWGILHGLLLVIKLGLLEDVPFTAIFPAVNLRLMGAFPGSYVW